MSENVQKSDQFGVPGYVIFGPNPKGGDNLTWDSLRSMTESDDRIAALESRLRTYLVSGLADTAKTAHPFSAAALVMIGIGSLGEILFRDGSSGEDASKQRFCKACNKIDQQFSRQLPNKGSSAFAKRWNTPKPKSMAEILYTYFRNSIVHSFHGRGLYLTGEETDTVKLTDDGVAMLNPTWLVNQYEKSSGNLLTKLLGEEENGPLRRNALDFLDKLVAQTALGGDSAPERE
jgi:hypothetical protein